MTAASARLDAAVGEPGTRTASPSPIVGWFDQDDGAALLGGVVELARLPARLAQFLAAVGKPIIFTPEREITPVRPRRGSRRDRGSGAGADGPDLRCGVAVDIGKLLRGCPGCGRAHAAVREDLVPRVKQDPVDEREHWSGCERGCRHPPTRTCGWRPRPMGIGAPRHG